MTTPASRVLLIGGSGFLGQHLMRACLLSKMEVRVADAVVAEVSRRENKVEYMQGDYRDPAFLHEIVDGSDVVFHLVHDSMYLNAECNMAVEFDRNIRPAIQLMEKCCELKTAKLIFLSSGGTVYGNHSVCAPISEDSRTHPISLYGTSKLMMEQIGFLYHFQKNLPFIVARPTNAYGPGQQPFRGQGFISTAFASVLAGRSVNVFGDGSVVRDYVHARDIADALVALINRSQPGEAYNIGTSIGTSLKTLINQYLIPIVSADGFEFRCEYMAARGMDVAYNVVSNEKLFRETGFVPSIGMDQGLRETWAWLKQNSGVVPA